MKKKNHFNIHTIMAVATTVCMLASGCSSAASTSDSAVPDTAKPVITIADKEVKATVNGKLNISTNVKVEDDTDGRLKKVDKLEDGKAGYTVDDTKVDMTKAGTYVVAVTAVDSAGNKAKSSFDVVVSEAKVEEKTDTEKTSGADKEEKKETSSAKSGNSDKVTSSSTAKPSTGNSSSSGSKPSSGTSNSASTSKPSTGSSSSSGSSSSGSTSKPSTGGSTSSGSSAAAKPSTGSSSSSGSSTGSGSSSNSGGSTTKPVCKDVVIVDQEAWDEQVLVKAAWDEQVLVKPAWDEQVLIKDAWTETYAIYHCGCGQDFDSRYDNFPEHTIYCEAGQSRVENKAIFHDAEYTTVHHDAEYTTVHHDAEYTTAHHAAVTHTEQVCS